MSIPTTLQRALRSPHLQEVDTALDALERLSPERTLELLHGARWDADTLHPGRLLHGAHHGRYACIRILCLTPEHHPELEPLYLGARKLHLDHRGDGRRRRALHDIPWLLRFPNLQHLHLAGYDISSLSNIRHSPIERLILQSCTVPPALDGLPATSTLQHLVVLDGSTPISSLERIAGASHLTELHLELSDDATLNGLAESPVATVHLHGGGFSTLQDVPRHVEQLHLTRCKGLRALAGLEHASRLQHLTLERCRRLENLDGIQACRTLTTLTATGLGKLTDIRAARALRNLTRLDLSACKRLDTLDGIPSTLTLTELVLSPLPSLERLDGLPKLLSVRSLDLSGAPLKSLTGIEQLHALAELSLRASTVSDLTPLAEIQTLRSLDLRGCRKLTDITPLQRLSGLERVTLKGSGVQPRDVPPGLRARCTWAEL